jgi:GNAT superfamily N-acetyltransferase
MSRTIRRLTLTEIGTLLDWAADEGWNPGLGDGAAFHAADPHGFLGAFAGDTMVAAIAAVAYDARFGFIGLYICHPHWRGQGHGKAVWDAGMAYLGDRTMGLDGVPEQQANYTRMGFVPAYQSVRMSGTLSGRGVTGPVAAPVPTEAILAYDAACFAAPRPNFLRAWLAPPNRLLTVVRDGALAGYAVLRPCRQGQKLGPVFARDLDAATALLDQVEGPVQIDVPQAQTAWMALLAQRGFTPGFATARMYAGAPPALPLHQVFGVTSLELG